jgi:hypothetical protein
MLKAELLCQLWCCITFKHHYPFLFVASEVDVYEQQWLHFVIILFGLLLFALGVTIVSFNFSAFCFLILSFCFLFVIAIFGFGRSQILLFAKDAQTISNHLLRQLVGYLLLFSASPLCFFYYLLLSLEFCILCILLMM